MSTNGMISRGGAETRRRQGTSFSAHSASPRESFRPDRCSAIAFQNEVERQLQRFFGGRIGERLEGGAGAVCVAAGAGPPLAQRLLLADPGQHSGGGDPLGTLHSPHYSTSLSS